MQSTPYSRRQFALQHALCVRCQTLIILVVPLGGVLEIIFFVNMAVSFVMATGLWLVWRSDKTQRFALSMALMMLLNGVTGIAFVLWKSPGPTWHVVGLLGIALSNSAMFVCLWHGAAALNHTRLSRRTLIAAGTVLFFAFLGLIESGEHTWVGLFNSTLWLATGAVTTRLLWNQGGLNRTVGILLTCGGVNSLFLVFYGADGMLPLFAVGIVMRVAIGISLMAAAMARTQTAIQEEKDRYKVLSNKAVLGIVVVTDAGLQYANPAAAHIFGYPSVEALLQGDVIAKFTPEKRVQAQSDFRKLVDGETEVIDTECCCLNRQGEQLFLQISAWRIQWEGSPAVQVAISDETGKYQAEQDVKKLQEQYEQQRVEFAERSKKALLDANAELEARVALRTRELQEASNAKSQFLASMSHEIRTPMNVVLGLLELLQASQQTHVQADYTHKAKRAAKSLLVLLNDLLDFSKVDAGKLELESIPFSLERLLRDLSNMIPTMVDVKPVEVLFDIDRDLPTDFVGDPMRLQQVLLNLLSNAIKFTPQGEVLVKLTLQSRTDRDAKFRVSVRDTGIGIAPEHQSHIFEVFAQAEATTTRRFGGSGLGLAICKRLLTLMRSDLALASQPGKGSTFYFDLTLPVAEPAEPELEVDDSYASDAGLRVLVIENNEVARKLLLVMAKALGWSAEGVENGSRAVERVQSMVMARQPLYEAILVDWKMEPLDGWQTIRRIRAYYPKGAMPMCVMVSAYGRDVLSQRSAEDQALISAYLTKPLTLSMLSEAVRGARQGQGNVRAEPRSLLPKGKRLQGLRVLLVEDNPLNQLVARELLTAEGALVQTADHGAMGVGMLAAEPQAFDAVLMDMQMPVMDGCTAAREIRTTLGLKDLPVIAMTANTMQSDKDACLAAGMNDHIGKPFDIAYLVEVLRRQCGREPYRPAMADPMSTPASTMEDGLDVEGAIHALGDDRALYVQILRAFLAELEDLPTTVAQQLAAGERMDAKRTLHTLKGTAATIGAMALSETARMGEADVMDGQPATDERLLEVLRDAAQKTLLQMAPFARLE